MFLLTSKKIGSRQGSETQVHYLKIKGCSVAFSARQRDEDSTVVRQGELTKQ